MALNDKEIRTRFARIGTDEKAHHVAMKNKISVKAQELAELIHEVVPGSREESESVTSVEMAVFWAHAGIDRRHC